MSGRLLIFGGTTEARELMERGLPAIYSAATEYGAELVKRCPDAETIVGRLDRGGIENLMRERRVTCVIDATHPYAEEVTSNISDVCSRLSIPLMRVLREPVRKIMRAEIFDDCAGAAEFLDGMDGNLLLTVGSKELPEFMGISDARERIYARVLPSSAVLRQCEELGLDAGHIFAMQGPFSEEMNIEMIRASRATFVVTKDGGASGGMAEKLGAAEKCGVKVVVIGRPSESGHSVGEALLWARRELGLKRAPLFPLLTDIEGRKAVVAGGGNIALRRAETLVRCGAAVTVVSPEFAEGFKTLSCSLINRKWKKNDMIGAVLAVAATDDREVNRGIGVDASEAGIPVSVADAAGESTFFFPSLITQDEVSLSVSTAGLSPAMTRRISDKVRSALPEWVSEERAALKGEKDYIKQ